MLLNGHDIVYVLLDSSIDGSWIKPFSKKMIFIFISYRIFHYNNKSFMNKVAAVAVLSLTLLAVYTSFNSAPIPRPNIQTEKETRSPWESDQCTEALAV